MKEFKDNEKISLIKKYYKKNQLFLELRLINYENHNLYICINEIKKKTIYIKKKKKKKKIKVID